MKTELRLRMLRIRQLETSRLVKDAKIQERAYKLLSVHQKIALYSSIRGEVNLSRLFEKLVQEEKEIYLPVVEEEIVFRRCQTLKGLKKSNLSVLEPIRGHSIDAKDLDAIVVPCLAVNKKGYRLGHGKGYYDRALNDYRGMKIAVVYEYQLIDDLFQEAHDVKMDYIVTENHIYKVGEDNV